MYRVILLLFVCLIKGLLYALSCILLHSQEISQVWWISNALSLVVAQFHAGPMICNVFTHFLVECHSFYSNFCQDMLVINIHISSYTDAVISMRQIPQSKMAG